MKSPAEIRSRYIAFFFNQFLGVFFASLFILSFLVFSVFKALIPSSFLTFYKVLFVVITSLIISSCVANKFRVSNLFWFAFPIACILVIVGDARMFYFETNHQGNPAGVVLCLLILLFCRVSFLAFHGQLNLSVNKKNENKTAYEKFYSESFNSLKVLGWMLIGSRVFNSVGNFRFKGGLGGGGGASGTW